MLLVLLSLLPWIATSTEKGKYGNAFYLVLLLRYISICNVLLCAPLKIANSTTEGLGINSNCQSGSRTIFSR